MARIFRHLVACKLTNAWHVFESACALLGKGSCSPGFLEGDTAMRTASQRYAENWVITIVLTMFLLLTSAAGLTVLRAVVFFGELSSLATQNGAKPMHASQTQP
jgi:hypothetical protein